MKFTKSSDGLKVAGVIVIIALIIGMIMGTIELIVIANILFVLVIIFHSHPVEEKTELSFHDVENKYNSIDSIINVIEKHESELNEKEIEYFYYKNGEYLLKPTVAKMDDLIRFGNYVLRNVKEDKEWFATCLWLVAFQIDIQYFLSRRELWT